jgi:ATP synthase protein I
MLYAITMAEHDDKRLTQKSGIVYGAVFSLAAAIVACLLLGWVLDRWLRTGPWLLVAGIVVGAVVGFYQFIRMMSKVS